MRSFTIWTGLNVQSFMVGAGLYMVAFAFGTNWDYRLIFLIFVLPALFQLRRGVRSKCDFCWVASRNDVRCSLAIALFSDKGDWELDPVCGVCHILLPYTAHLGLAPVPAMAAARPSETNFIDG
jgi:hypothetical protein